jgi:pimeloyl-ACP methyl ester carboxylesterase
MSLLSLIPRLNRWLSPLFPGLAARFARRLLMTPQQHPTQDWEKVTPADGRIERFGPGLVARHYGAGPKVLMLHGWSGRHTQFGPLINALVARGLCCITLDPPAHGSSPGREAHPVAFADAMFEAAEAFGPIHAVVGHSMGAGATAFTLTHELAARRAVLIAGPASMARVLTRFCDLLELAPAARTRLFALVSRHMGVDEGDLDVERLPEPAAVEVLLVHDADDAEVPIADAEAIHAAWPRTRVLRTSGLGHRRVLSDPATVETVTAFLTR